jgi:hypothetical protein
MKTIEKRFDAVKFMREQREQLSEKLSGMTNVEIVEYFKKKKTESAINKEPEHVSTRIAPDVA